MMNVPARDGASLYVQYGCGFDAPGGWINFDSSPTLRFERIPVLGRLYTRNSQRFPANVRYGDIVRGLPIPPGSCRGVFASHVLEHLSLHDMRTALRRTWELLQPGGIFRLVVPDLEGMAREYLSSPAPDAALTFLRHTGLGREERPRGVKALLQSLGGSEHFWMWDYKSMKSELEAAGFTAIRPCQPHDSADPFFKEVENVPRFSGAVAVEALRPAPAGSSMSFP